MYTAKGHVSEFYAEYYNRCDYPEMFEYIKNYIQANPHVKSPLQMFYASPATREENPDDRGVAITVFF